MQSALSGLQQSASDAQYGLFGQVVSLHSKQTTEAPSDKRIYMNSSAPFSALLCGVQGAGKSHTLATMLENLLIPNFKPIGSLEDAMSALVLHFGEGGSSSLPSEVTWLASTSSDFEVELPKVRVFVSPSSIRTMHTAYTSVLGDKVEVYPLYFTEAELDAAAILSMMSVSSSDSAPLYMQLVLERLRKLGENFSFSAFKHELDDLKGDLNPLQKASLEQRLALLYSFLESSRSKAKPSRPTRFAKGQLTIIDLSDPFIDADSACGIFNIICRLFTRVEVGTGKVLVIDEAHKYLSLSRGGSTELTKRILSIIRQQRHLGIRVIISTQEPTILPPVIIDLCTVIILHRFQSPAWWEHIVKHVSADFSLEDAFDRVVRLQTGQSVIFAPSGIGMFKANELGGVDDLGLFGRRYLICKTRKRLTDDGGASILATRPSD